MKKTWKTAIYARVSTDKKEQQESVPAQIQSLKEWLEDKSKADMESVYELVEIYEDIGCSGSNFDRDNFIRMKEDIEKNKINMILTRDLSRFSRNYILAGYYIEDYFKVNGIRFVSVLDNVDTLEEVNDIVPFKNILNEMYIKDCSRKVKDALRQRMLRGSSIASRPPYGYKFDKIMKDNSKSIKLVPAMDQTTEIVKEIFSLYLTGFGISRIATCLNEKRIPPPSAEMNHYRAKFGLWTPNSVRSILTNPKYAGIMAQQRYKKLSYKVKKTIPTSQEEWIIGDNFTGIVDEEIFNKVQDLLKKRAREYRNKGEIHLFSSLLRCNECGGSMSYRKNYEGYKCTNSQIGGKRCTSHSIKEEVLLNRVIEDLKGYVNLIDRGKFYKLIQKMNTSQIDYNESKNHIEKKLILLNKRIDAVYEDKISGIINQGNFEAIIKDIQNKQEEFLNKLKELELQKDPIAGDTSFSDTFKNKIDKILDMEDIDRFFLEGLIDKIIVCEDKKLKDTKVYIYYKFKMN